MERRLDQDLDRVRQMLLKMGGMVEGMVAKATQSLLDRNNQLSADVIEGDNEVDRLEIEIDELCHLILGTKQPTAVDLRFLVAVMKINSDLERIGDSAVNIAQSVLQLNEQPPLKPYIDLPRLSLLVQDMVRRSLDAFVRRDARLATDVCESDDAVDGLYKQLFRELLTYMIEDPKTVSRALHLLLVSRNMERIADHATNIAEDVIYYVEGRDIRHSGSHVGDEAVRKTV
ncbi:MAG TPA: phosphate signaling complex protein PhoU [Thermoanaerobaculia bacterium]|jgi:phosphate transport system protein|nr:phosphate signaling complex protein PhoU [Thermoanaerobaculia bacterium]